MKKFLNNLKLALKDKDVTNDFLKYKISRFKFSIILLILLGLILGITEIINFLITLS